MPLEETFKGVQYVGSTDKHTYSGNTIAFEAARSPSQIRDKCTIKCMGSAVHVLVT